MKNTFKKEERLCHKKKIDALFDKSNKDNESFAVYPLRVIYANKAGYGPTEVLFSVSKRKFKKAVDRNLIKRRLREAYRLNKVLLDQRQFYIAFLYLSSEKLEYSKIEAPLKKILQRLSEKAAS